MTTTTIVSWDEGPMSRRHDKSNTPLSLDEDQKKLLATLILSQNATAKQLGDVYKMRYKYLSNLAYKKKHHKPIRGNVGQPSILKETDVTTLYGGSYSSTVTCPLLSLFLLVVLVTK